MVDLLLSEVDADVRAEKMAALWRQWRQPVAVFCVTLVLVTAGVQGWNHHRQTRGARWLNQLAMAQKMLDSGKPAEAATGFAEVASHASGEARSIAQLWQARALVAANQTPEAVAVLKAATQGDASLWSDLACLRLAALEPKAASCLSVKSGSPLQRQRQLWHAAQRVQQGDKATARQTLSELAADEGAPPATRAMAAQWLASIEVTP